MGASLQQSSTRRRAASSASKKGTGLVEARLRRETAVGAGGSGREVEGKEEGEGEEEVDSSSSEEGDGLDLAAMVMSGSGADVDLTRLNAEVLASLPQSMQLEVLEKMRDSQNAGKWGAGCGVGGWLEATGKQQDMRGQRGGEGQHIFRRYPVSSPGRRSMCMGVCSFCGNEEKRRIHPVRAMLPRCDQHYRNQPLPCTFLHSQCKPCTWYAPVTCATVTEHVPCHVMVTLVVVMPT
ncbi:hypothetical protein V8C86DRAFT_513310 [Haematococcus lacustris]